MIDGGKKNVIGVLIDAVDEAGALRRIGAAAQARRPLAVSALAVHGVMTGRLDPAQRARLNRLDLVVADGQPVRWALNLLHRTALPERVYGPNLMLATCELAAREGWGVYLYGSTAPVLDRLARSLTERFPELTISGREPSKFRSLAADEKADVIRRIRASGARVVFVGLGCPRQEVWAYEYRSHLSLPILAVGAAFDFHAGTSRQAPPWMRDRGLEWLFRLASEPWRLWRRYVLLNPRYVALVAAQLLRLRRFPSSEPAPIVERSYG